ncbi:hypothetical protein FLT15_25300 [Paenibacillus thiaminolyticus]|nr:hypothetical protein [Paenibacillus thiaminolyticus]NGP61542.1 hypothetical protein [Paenibacillus thiaminolyticus]
MKIARNRRVSSTPADEPIVHDTQWAVGESGLGAPHVYVRITADNGVRG